MGSRQTTRRRQGKLKPISVNVLEGILYIIVVLMSIP